MSQKSDSPKPSSERLVRDIRRATRRHYSAEEKIRIVLDGLRGEHSIAELCRREGKIAAFVDHYNHRRYHESLKNLTPIDVYCGRGAKILRERERIKRITIENRRLQHQMTAA